MERGRITTLEDLQQNATRLNVGDNYEAYVAVTTEESSAVFTELDKQDVTYQVDLMPPGHTTEIVYRGVSFSGPEAIARFLRRRAIGSNTPEPTHT